MSEARVEGAGEGAEALDLGRRFDALMNAEVLAGYRRATYLGIPLVMGFGILDLLSVADTPYFRLFIGLRVALSCLLVVLLKIAERGRAWVLPAVVTGTYFVGSAIALMSALLGHQSFYYAGMNVVILAIGLLVPMGPWPMLGSSLAIYGTFVGLTIALDPTPLGSWDWGLFLSNSVFILVTCAVVTVGAYVNRLLRRTAFDATAAQEKANAELRTANDQIQANYAELADKQRELEEAYRVKSQFLDNMSHELRTPLTCILTPLEGLLDADSDAPAETREIYEDMHQASTQLYDLINDLLDYSRYGAREVPLRREPVDLARLIEDNVRAWMPTARQRRIRLRWRRPEARMIALLDGRELGKVIRNLLSNAIKFTAAEGEVEISLTREEGELIFAVRDTGIGMDEAVLGQIFRPFFQADGSSTRSVAGTGLGLSLVKTIIERHEGTITATSAVGAGTTMSVRLPYLEVSDSEAVSMALPESPFVLAGASGRRVIPPVIERYSRPPEAPPEPTPADAAAAQEGAGPHLVVVGASDSSPSWSAMYPLPSALKTLSEHQDEGRRERSRVLVVDDQPELLRLITRILGRDHEVITASDGEEGLQRVHDVRPDVVISDVMMPRMNGFELVEALRRDESTRTLPVLLLTARADGTDKVRGLRRGANDYLVKPFLPEELKARVRNLLRMRRYESYLTNLNEELESSRDSLEGRLHGLFIDTVRTLVAAIDAKDFYTGGHSERVSHFAVRLGEHMKMPRPMVRTIELGALLHDVGKIGIPDRVLNKPGRLSDEEIEIIRQHTVFGGRILEKSPELSELRRFALHHHERWDGAGYPDGLRGEEIPSSVRVVSVADCWDAMISDRVYRPGMEPRIAAEKVAKLRGNQFDPAVVEALMELWPELDVPPHLRPLKPRLAPVEDRAGPRVSECGEVYHVHD
ncbi:MAG: response regulator [Myxococcales bacterium]|nr:response regulator [Myxococcales bacterium]